MLLTLECEMVACTHMYISFQPHICLFCLAAAPFPVDWAHSADISLIWSVWVASLLTLRMSRDKLAPGTHLAARLSADQAQSTVSGAGKVFQCFCCVL